MQQRGWASGCGTTCCCAVGAGPKSGPDLGPDGPMLLLYRHLHARIWAPAGSSGGLTRCAAAGLGKWLRDDVLLRRRRRPAVRARSGPRWANAPSSSTSARSDPPSVSFTVTRMGHVDARCRDAAQSMVVLGHGQRPTTSASMVLNGG